MHLNNQTIPSKENATDLQHWMFDVDVYIVDAVLEFLEDRELLTEQGERVAHKFWEMFIKNNVEYLRNRMCEK